MRDYFQRAEEVFCTLINPFKNYATSVLTRRKHVRIDSARACRAELDVVQRNVLSCHEIIKVGVESGANNKFKGVNTS